MTIVVFV